MPRTWLNTVPRKRITPYGPSSTMIPENSTHTGVGATACASASQKWNGTAAALTSSPVHTSTHATRTSTSGPPTATSSWANPSCPVRAYSTPIPINVKYAPTELTTPKLSAPCTVSASSTLYAVRAYATPLISSKKTNMVNTSPVNRKPSMPARNSRTIAWKRASTVSKYRQP